MKMMQFIFCFLLAMFLCGLGCSSLKPAPSPLAGWKVDLDHDPDQAIEKDYHDYIQKLPPNNRNYVGPAFYLEDGTGQHAINIEVFVKGQNASWHYAIIYDKENKRVKAVKYGYTRYQS
jgi:hypothetical protein